MARRRFRQSLRRFELRLATAYLMAVSLGLVTWVTWLVGSTIPPVGFLVYVLVNGVLIGLTGVLVAVGSLDEGDRARSQVPAVARRVALWIVVFPFGALSGTLLFVVGLRLLPVAVEPFRGFTFASLYTGVALGGHLVVGLVAIVGAGGYERYKRS